MVLTLARDGSSYSTANKRYFEAWGAVDYSAGVQTRNPSQRYCANLGHVEDDESGLTYMRARYYEPTSGRFLSEDPARIGHNWFAYCQSNPIFYSDESGTVARPLWATVLGAGLYTAGMILMHLGSMMVCFASTPSKLIAAASMGTMAVLFIGIGLTTLSYGDSSSRGHLASPLSILSGVGAGVASSFFTNVIVKNVAAQTLNAAVGAKTHAANAVVAMHADALLC